MAGCEPFAWKIDLTDKDHTEFFMITSYSGPNDHDFDSMKRYINIDNHCCVFEIDSVREEERDALLNMFSTPFEDKTRQTSTSHSFKVHGVDITQKKVMTDVTFDCRLVVCPVGHGLEEIIGNSLDWFFGVLLMEETGKLCEDGKTPESIEFFSTTTILTTKQMEDLISSLKMHNEAILPNIDSIVTFPLKECPNLEYLYKAKHYPFFIETSEESISSALRTCAMWEFHDKINA